MRKLHIIAGVLIMTFAGVFYLKARQLSFGTIRSPGPGFVPSALGTILFLFALIFVLKSVFKRSLVHDTGNPWEGMDWKRIPFTLAILLGYALFLDHLGYLVCTSILLGILFWGEGVWKKWVAIVGSPIIAIASYVLFKRLLGVQLPWGFLTFLG
ncbi:MAG: tripartite tricarboxylate transporter TctB family protein [Deltaproteobacteria bacterium]|nr:tripartite tricarboxylate transporter TctB family protein [Deltaproteobacteria bacterium]MBI2087420.1 tripartite tricarboxylate transporter TctB family protein [Deltaproteobacteria bacterium]